MKKLFLILTLLLFNLNPIFANNFTTSLRPNPITIEPSEEFVVNVNVANMNGIVAIEGNFNYDSTKLQLVQSEFEYNGFDVAIGTRLVVDFKTPRSGSFTAAQVRFRPRAGFSVGQSTTITFTSVSGSNGTTDFNGTNSSTTVTMTPAKSSNNFLSSLSLSSGTLNFSKAVTSYVVDVENNVSNITISGTVEDPKSRVTGLGTFPLNIYENNFNVVVTAENGSRRTYSINVRRKDEQGNPIFVSGSTDINNIILSACTLEFSNSLDAYSCEVRNDVNQTSLEVLSSDTTQKLEYLNQITLLEGGNTIEVRVIAENNDVRTITIEITRLSDIFYVPVSEALTALSSISISTLGISLEEAERVPSSLLNEAYRLGKTLLINKDNALILITSTQELNQDVFIDFRTFTSDDLVRFNFALGQFVGLNTPLPQGIQGAWYINDDLRAYELNIFDINDPSTPLRLASIDGIIEVSDLTQALFITPASVSNTTSLPWLWIGAGGGAGLLLGFLLSLLIRRR
jgi:hypothetical protein